jgi:thioredoxin reductase
VTQELLADILIVGAGPAGLAAAMECRRLGVPRVVVLEREAEAGGVPRHCGHPPFGMSEFNRVLSGPAYARRLAAAAHAAGVGILTRHHVVSLEPGGVLKLATPKGLLTARATRVLLAMGARETPRSARLVGGQRPLGVMNTGALQSHLYLHGLLPFRAPVIVGTELVALSALWSCLKAGIKPVAMVEGNDRPTARRPLSWLPHLCRVPVHYGAQVADIRGTARVGGVSLRDRAGNRRELECDGVLFTGGFLPEASLIRASHLALDAFSGGPLVDQYGRCSDPSYFAAGNVLRAVETAGWSFREGRRIGRHMAGQMALAIAPGRVEDAQAPAGAIRVAVGEGVKYVVPGTICPGEPGGEARLQLRVPAAIAAVLLLKIDGEIVWRRRVTALPERRIVVPLPPIPASARSIWIGFEAAVSQD